MSGIAGEINFKNRPIVEKVIKMRNVLAHRGPDVFGLYNDGCAVLGQTKNCNNELEKNSYMMEHRTENEKYVIVFDGDIYNKSELKDELSKYNYRFKTNDDTEVVLYAYAEWGENCINKVNGAFAFVIWESHSNELFIARDQMGVKPFFYSVNNDSFLFASEIKGILAHPETKSEINKNSIAEIMLLGPGRTPGCGIFNNIFELMPAHFGYFTNNGLKLKKYWQLQDNDHTDSFEQTKENVKQMLLKSIISQIDEDKTVGTFLSGGLDSSIISSVVDKEFYNAGKKLHTFSVTYKDHDKYFKATDYQPNNDDYFINKMKNELTGYHHDIILENENLLNNLYNAVDARDLPGMADIDSSLLLLCKEIKKYVNIGLSGECADEIFGGYPWYQDEKIRNINGFPWSQSTKYRSGFLNKDFNIDADLYVQSRYEETIKQTSKIKDLNEIDSRIKETTNLTCNWFMQTLIDRNDRMSMYNTFSVRAPFCDYKIAQYLYSVPWEFKNYKGYEKGLLREAMSEYLPAEVLWRKKSPYPKTHNPEYLKMVSELLKEEISNPNAPILDILDKTKIEELLNVPNNSIPWYGQLMTSPQTLAYFIQINYWLKKYKIEII